MFISDTVIFGFDFWRFCPFFVYFFQLLILLSMSPPTIRLKIAPDPLRWLYFLSYNSWFYITCKGVKSVCFYFSLHLPRVVDVAHNTLFSRYASQWLHLTNTVFFSFLFLLFFFHRQIQLVWSYQLWLAFLQNQP